MSARNIVLGAAALLGVAAVLAFAVDSGAQASDDKLVVYKTPWCGCCAAWVDYMEEAGFDVEVHDMENVDPIKDEQGVHRQLRSCHTATIGGYALEGHVPAEQVTRMLAERPEIRGLAVPGMPIGSPGMEQGDPANYDDFDVVAFTNDGDMSVYARIEQGQ